MTRRLLTAVAVLMFATTASASWYDDYAAGIKAIRAGDYKTAIARMTAAINAHPKEEDNARTYGAIFINYHPFYYRGVAYLNTGQYQAALDDLEKTSGPGEIDRGSVEALVGKAKDALAGPTPPPPTPVPPTPAPQPVGPVVDQALKRRAAAAVANAQQKFNEARARNANSPAIPSAAKAFGELVNRNAAAQTNDDFNRVISEAESVVILAEAVVAPAPVPVPQPVPTPQPPTPKPPIPKPISATGSILAPYERDIRRALENYFAGEFEEASKQFGDLTSKLPDNAWLYAFLGASQYSQYAFEADEAYKNAAMESFRKAKQLRSWKGGLPQKYFSRRIRRVFETAG
jgi:tetratricopeptide (TPR) repeat protein